jgi:hypothetical protein
VRLGASILHAWGELRTHLDGARHAVHLAQQDMRTGPTDLMAPRTGGEGQGVGDRHHTGSRPELGAKHQCVIQVLP